MNNIYFIMNNAIYSKFQNEMFISQNKSVDFFQFLGGFILHLNHLIA